MQQNCSCSSAMPEKIYLCDVIGNQSKIRRLKCPYYTMLTLLKSNNTSGMYDAL